MIAPSDRQPIVVADAGPLIRLAAAGILDTLRGLNRRIVLVDRVEDEVVGDLTKPFAPEIAAWIGGLGEAALRVETVVGIGVAALREFVAHWHPSEAASAVVLYEDRKVATLFLDVNFPVTLMTTRAFVATVTRWGIEYPTIRRSHSS
ncbi:MAG TPA: hypothetical protein VF641_10060 [Methylobacterium sp.]